MYYNILFYNLINLPLQFIVLVTSILYLKRITLSMKICLLGTAFIFVPAVMIFSFVNWVGIIYFIITLVSFFTFYTNEKSTIFYVAIVLIMAVITDHLASLLVSNFTFTSYLNEIICRAIIFIIFFFTVIYIIRFVSEDYLKKFSISPKTKVLLNIVVVLTILVFYLNIFRVLGNASIEALRLNTIIFIFYLFLMFFLLGMIIYNFINEENLKVREKEYENFISYITSLEQVNKDMQKFRHDYLNILLSMKGYIDDKDWRNLEIYFNQRILNVEQKTLISTSIIGNLNNLHIKSLKGLLFNKSSKALELDIEVSIEVPQIVQHILFDEIILNRILGIFIDNAIENCIEDQTKQILISVLHKENEYTMITIGNKIMDKKIDLNKIFRDGFTTKPNHRGVGLATVEQIVDENSQLTLNTWIENNWFYIELIYEEGR